jgi:prepilin-type N-terminal cleavage/methylation domain-containing protein
MKNALNSSTKFKQRGLTLLEVAVALVVAALVITGALALYYQANNQSTTNTLTTAITALRSTVKSGLLSGTPTVGSLNDQIIATGKVPSTLTVSGSIIRHPAGGTLDVAGNADGSFSFTATNVPNNVCMDLTSNLLTNFTQVQINASPQTATLGLASSTIVTQCSAGASGISTIKFTT